MEPTPNHLGLWPLFRRLVNQFREGRYWTQRRDACEEIGRVARQAAFRVRQAAEDKDPDVAHWGRQALAQLAADSRMPLAELTMQFDHDLEIEVEEEAAAAPTPPGRTTPPAPGETLGEATPATAAESHPQPEAAPKAAPTPEELLAWLAEFARQLGGRFQERPGGAQLDFALKADRRQTLFIDLAQKESDGAPVALFYSICGEADPDGLGWALEANAKLARGAFGVIRQGGRAVLVMMLRRPLARLSLDDLPGDLEAVAQRADWAEARLHPEDRH